MDKILIIIVLFGIGIFFIGKMFNPPVGPKYKLKSILFNPENSQVSQELGKLIFISRGKEKLFYRLNLTYGQRLNFLKMGLF